MTDSNVLDPIVANARIVRPEDVAGNVAELAMMKVMIMAATRDGVPAHFVQYPDGVVALVHADPSDTAAWNALLSQTHAAALLGEVGPIEAGAKERP